MPGPNLQFRALNKSTSKLPKIDANTVDKAIGNNTADAILSGVIRGSAKQGRNRMFQAILPSKISKRVVTASWF